MTELELRALAEMVADVLVERGIVGEPADRLGRVLDAAAVARGCSVASASGSMTTRTSSVRSATARGRALASGSTPRPIERWKRDRQRGERRGGREPCPRPARRARGRRERADPYKGSGRGA